MAHVGRSTTVASATDLAGGASSAVQRNIDAFQKRCRHKESLSSKDFANSGGKSHRVLGWKDNKLCRWRSCTKVRRSLMRSSA
jgi:hypothetical protein